MNLRRTITALAFSGLVAVGASTTAFAADTTPATTKPNPLKCVGAAEHKQAMSLHLQGAQANLAALNLRLTAAQQAANTKATARITARIAEVNARIARIQQRQTTFATRCP